MSNNKQAVPVTVSSGHSGTHPRSATIANNPGNKATGKKPTGTETPRVQLGMDQFLPKDLSTPVPNAVGGVSPQTQAAAPVPQASVPQPMTPPSTGSQGHPHDPESGFLARAF